jgi:lipopolysaccharide export system permease protein
VSTAHFQYGRIIGFGIGVLLSTLYWALLFAGQTFGVRTDIHPFLLMFFPNFFLGGLGLLFFMLLKNR